MYFLCTPALCLFLFVSPSCEFHILIFSLASRRACVSQMSFIVSLYSFYHLISFDVHTYPSLCCAYLFGENGLSLIDHDIHELFLCIYNDYVY